MARKSGGAQQLRKGDRVRIDNGCYRHYLKGLEGVVTIVYFHGVIVALDNDPSSHQRIVSQGTAGKPVVKAQRLFQYNEVEKIEPPPPGTC